MRAVFALCLLALVGVQVALAGEIYYQSYTADFVNHPENFFCNGTATITSQNATAGACKSLDNNATSYQLYCDGGNAVIRIGYSYGYCGAANATTMSRTPTVCGAGNTAGMWKCSGTDALPNGWTFPPTGQWAQSTIQYNNTWDGSAYGPSSVGACGTLPASARAVNVQAASYAGCTNTQATTYTQASSSQQFSGGYSGSYSGLDCKTLVTLTQGFGTASCKNGATGTGVPDGNPAPSAPTNVNSLTASRTYYEKSGSNLCGNKLATTYFSTLCLNGFKVDCNNSIYTESKYTLTDGGNGACSGTYQTGYPAVKNTSSSFCEQIGTADNGYQYSCSGSSPDTGAASTASFSVVALVIAAIVALLSQ